MELRHLRYFVAVAEELHFARAASKLNIAQPALSQQIQSLEKELGVKLLVRSTRNVALTDAGSAFYDRSLAILNEVESSAALARAAAGEELRKIRIGTIYPATFGILPGFLSRIRSRYPAIKLHIKSDTTDNIVRDIERGSLNLGFIRPAQNMGSLAHKTLCKERYLLAVANENPLSRKQEIGLDELRSQRIIAFVRSNLTYTEKYFDRLFRDHGLAERISYTCNDTLSLIALVSAGAGVGFVPEWAEGFANRKFVLRKVKEVDLDIGLALAWNRKDPIAHKDDIIEIASSFARPRRA
jgi:DNA-binding transcriptional LysR family regulator